MTVPTVSIVVPTHNRAPILRRAMRSALDQTFGDFELIIVDDASTDATEETVRSVGDIRIKYFRHDVNRGVAAARNTAILHSCGRYVAFLDDDDEWLPTKLERQLALLESSPPSVGGVYSGSIKVDRATGTVLDQIAPSKRGRLFDQMLAKNWIGPTSAVVLRKACLDRVGLFDTELVFGEDYDLWLRLSREFEFDYIAEPLVRFYVQETGMSKDADLMLRGAEARFRKHEPLLAGRPRLLSARCVRLGVKYVRAGRLARGRREFLKAIRLQPWFSKAYYNLGISFFGVRGFVAIKRLQDTVWRQKHVRVLPDRGVSESSSE